MNLDMNYIVTTYESFTNSEQKEKIIQHQLWGIRWNIDNPTEGAITTNTRKMIIMIVDYT